MEQQWLDILGGIVYMVLFSLLFIAVPYKAVMKRQEITLFTPKLVLYFCTELSFAEKFWEKYKNKIKVSSDCRLSMPLLATVNGVFHYPLKRGFLFAVLVILTGGAVLYISDLFQIISIADLEGTLSYPLVVIVCTLPFLSFYITSFCSENYQKSKNQEIVKQLLLQIGWNEYSNRKIEQIYKEVYADFLLYKKTNDMGTIILFLGTGAILLYSRLEPIKKIVSENTIILLFILFFVIVLAKNYYDGFRSRVIYIALNTLLDLAAEREELEAGDEQVLSSRHDIKIDASNSEKVKDAGVKMLS